MESATVTANVTLAYDSLSKAA